MTLEEKASNRAVLTSLGYSVGSILDLDENTFNSFKTNFVGILGSLYEDNEGMLDALNKESDIPVGDYLEGTQSLVDSLNSLDLSSINAGINSSYDDLLSFNDGLQATQLILETIAETIPKALQIFPDTDSSSTSGSGGGGGGSSSDANADDNIKGTIGRYNEVLKGVMGGFMYDPFSILADSMAKSVDAVGQEAGYLKNMINTTFTQIASIYNNATFEEQQAIEGKLSELLTQYGVQLETFKSAYSMFAEDNTTSELYSKVLTIMQSDASSAEYAYEELLAKYQEYMLTISDETLEMTEEQKNMMLSQIDEVLTRLAEAQAELNGIEIKSQTQLNAIKGTIQAVQGRQHSNGTVGNAFYNGTRYNGLSSSEKGALRSEYGQPELTVYPNGTYELTTTPTISDLPKGTVIFNEDQTNRILKGSAYATGTNIRPLSLSDPDKYSMLTSLTRLTDSVSPMLQSIEKNIEDISKKFGSVVSPKSIHSSGDIVLSVGDIHLANVQDVNGLSKAIVNQLPNMLIQEINKRR